jgi:hypothetical protein
VLSALFRIPLDETRVAQKYKSSKLLSTQKACLLSSLMQAPVPPGR